MGSLSLLQGIFPNQGLNPGLPHCEWILYQLSHKGSPRILEWVTYSFSSGSSNPGIEPGSPALQADSLPAELPGKPTGMVTYLEMVPLKMKVKVKVTQSCPTLCDPMDYTVHGIFLARILKWVAFPFSGGSSQPRDQTQVSRVAGGFFTSRATRGAPDMK